MHNQKPFFSIVIPTRDRPDLIQGLIWSILEQTFSNLELIICDNSNNDLTQEKYLSSLKDSRFQDRQYRGTNIGPHRSDLIAIINDEFEASLLSTGQQKTIVLMVLLAQCYYLIYNKNISPILLLDEIASHLDVTNRHILLDMINRFDIQ